MALSGAVMPIVSPSRQGTPIAYAVESRNKPGVGVPGGRRARAAIICQWTTNFAAPQKLKHCSSWNFSPLGGGVEPGYWMRMSRI